MAMKCVTTNLCRVIESAVAAALGRPFRFVRVGRSRNTMEMRQLRNALVVKSKQGRTNSEPVPVGAHQPKTNRSNTEPNHRDPKNLGVVIMAERRPKFTKTGIGDPTTHFNGNTIRIRGVVISNRTGRTLR